MKARDCTFNPGSCDPNLKAQADITVYCGGTASFTGGVFSGISSLSCLPPPEAVLGSSAYEFMTDDYRIFAFAKGVVQKTQGLDHPCLYISWYKNAIQAGAGGSLIKTLAEGGVLYKSDTILRGLALYDHGMNMLGPFGEALLQPGKDAYNSFCQYIGPK